MKEISVKIISVSNMIIKLCENMNDDNIKKLNENVLEMNELIKEMNIFLQKSSIF